ncbi:MAG: metallophosphoesterase [Lachnospiraceae bacterium]|nr:metallophosphoesterase [Lachnospiraceae bacterium]
MLNIVLMILFFVVLVLIWVMLFDSTRFVIVKYTIPQCKLKKGYRAVVLADLHNKQFGRNNELLLKAIEEQKPDGIWIAGDILTAHPGKSMQIAIDLVSELAKKYPVYYGNGNHEHRLKLYPETYGDMAEEYAKALEQAGIRPLVNEHVLLEEYNLCIYGAEIDREYYKRFTVSKMEQEYLQRILGNPDEKRYNVLLAHHPDYFPNYAKWGADLVLAGHVHGGMVRIPGWKGVVSPSIRLFPHYDGGKFTEGKSTMLLSRGLGMHTIPVRLFNPGELVVVEFEEEKVE